MQSYVLRSTWARGVLHSGHASIIASPPVHHPPPDTERFKVDHGFCFTPKWQKTDLLEDLEDKSGSFAVRSLGGARTLDPSSPRECIASEAHGDGAECLRAPDSEAADFGSTAKRETTATRRPRTGVCSTVQMGDRKPMGCRVNGVRPASTLFVFETGPMGPEEFRQVLGRSIILISSPKTNLMVFIPWTKTYLLVAMFVQSRFSRTTWEKF